MSYAMAYGPCCGCGRVFGFNPVHVPSLPAHLTSTGTKEPICMACVTAANPKRIANGLAPIVPHPEAYESCHESELDR